MAVFLEQTELMVAKLKKGNSEQQNDALASILLDVKQIRDENSKPVTTRFSNILESGNCFNLLFGPDYYNETLLI